MTDFKHAKRNRKWDTSFTILLLVLLLLCTNFLISKINYSIDLTTEQKYSLSLETVSRLNRITEPIDIIITIPESNNLPKVIQKLLFDLNLILESYQKARSNKIRIHRINIDSALTSSNLINKFNLVERNEICAYSETGKKKLIFKYKEPEGINILDRENIFRSKDSLAREKIWESGFYDTWTEGANGIMEPSEFLGEEVILRSILEITATSKQQHVAYFSRGHGEGSPSDINPIKGFSELRSILENQNIKVSTIDISTISQMPSNAKLLFITDPRGTFQDKEISVISDYINRENGNLIIAFDPSEEISTMGKPAFGFRTLLKQWGIRCHDMLIHDPIKNNFDVFTGDYSLKTYSREKSHRVVNKLRDGAYSVQSSRLRPVEKITSEIKDLITSEILFSRRSSWALSSWINRTIPPILNDLLDLKGPVPVIALSEIDKGQKNDLNSRKGKVAVMGSSSILTNKRLKENTGNRFLTKNIINWMIEERAMLDIEPKSISTYNINLNEREYVNLLYALSVIPISTALIGLFVGWLRKEL